MTVFHRGIPARALCAVLIILLLLAFPVTAWAVGQDALRIPLTAGNR